MDQKPDPRRESLIRAFAEAVIIFAFVSLFGVLLYKSAALWHQ